MSFKIGEAHRKVPHLIADLIELLLVIQYEGRSKLHQSDVSSILSQSDRSSEELDENEIEPGSTAENINLEDTWEHLKYRQIRFGISYPFTVTGDFIEIVPAGNDLQRIYRFLLACSRLKSFNSQLRYSWATYFSKLCAVAMEYLMPTNASIKVFDANSDDRQNYYGTDLRDALIVLGNDLDPHYIHRDTCKKQHSSGDAQLDLVGVVSYQDSAVGAFVILGQCAARETEWPSKRMEAHPAVLDAYFSLLPTPANLCFIPVCYRSNNGEWVNEAKVTGCLLIDRVRIMSALVHSNRYQVIINSQWFLDFETNFPLGAK